jgi:hypothetical protein
MAATAVEERNMALVVFAFLLGLRMSKGVLFWMRIEAVVEKKNLTIARPLRSLTHNGLPLGNTSTSIVTPHDLGRRRGALPLTSDDDAQYEFRL